MKTARNRKAWESVTNEEIEMKAMKAILFFQDGWSLTISMSKAGFPTDWRRHENINNHLFVNKLRDLYRYKLKTSPRPKYN